MIRLTNEQWERIRNHFPEEHIPDGRPGRKPIPTRCVFEAVTRGCWHQVGEAPAEALAYAGEAKGGKLQWPKIRDRPGLRCRRVAASVPSTFST
jgi:hypothetical protein